MLYDELKGFGGAHMFPNRKNLEYKNRSLPVGGGGSIFKVQCDASIDPKV